MSLLHLTVVTANREVTHDCFRDFVLWNNTSTTLGSKLFQFVRYPVIMVLSMEQHENVIFPIIQKWNNITSRKCSDLWTQLDGQLLYEIVTQCTMRKILSFDLIFFGAKWENNHHYSVLVVEHLGPAQGTLAFCRSIQVVWEPLLKRMVHLESYNF